MLGLKVSPPKRPSNRTRRLIHRSNDGGIHTSAPIGAVAAARDARRDRDEHFLISWVGAAAVTVLVGAPPTSSRAIPSARSPRSSIRRPPSIDPRPPPAGPTPSSAERLNLGPRGVISRSVGARARARGRPWVVCDVDIAQLEGCCLRSSLLLRLLPARAACAGCLLPAALSMDGFGGQEPATRIMRIVHRSGSIG